MCAALKDGQRTLFAEDSPARMSPALARALALLGAARDSGLSFFGSSQKYDLDGSLLRTWQAAQIDGSIRYWQDWGSKTIMRYRSRCRRKMSELRTSADESLLSLTRIPTPQARDHFPPHSVKYIREKISQGHGMRNLNDVIAHVTLATPTETGNQLSPSMRKWPGCEAWQKIHPAGPLLPSFVGWLMGFPTGWTDCEPSATPSSRSAPK